MEDRPRSSYYSDCAGAGRHVLRPRGGQSNRPPLSGAAFFHCSLWLAMSVQFSVLNAEDYRNIGEDCAVHSESRRPTNWSRFSPVPKPLRTCPGARSSNNDAERLDDRSGVVVRVVGDSLNIGGDAVDGREHLGRIKLANWDRRALSPRGWRPRGENQRRLEILGGPARNVGACDVGSTGDARPPNARNCQTGRDGGMRPSRPGFLGMFRIWTQKTPVAGAMGVFCYLGAGAGFEPATFRL